MFSPIKLFLFAAIFSLVFLFVDHGVKDNLQVEISTNPYEYLDNKPYLLKELGGYGEKVVVEKNGILYTNRHPANSPNYYNQIYKHLAPKSEGVIRTIFLGNSQVFYVADGGQIPLPYELERSLNIKGQNKYEVINLSCFGMGISEILINLIKATNDLKPDLIIIAVNPRDLVNEQVKNIGMATEYSYPNRPKTKRETLVKNAMTDTNNPR